MQKLFNPLLSQYCAECAVGMDAFSFKRDTVISFFECPCCSKGILTDFGRGKIDMMLNHHKITPDHPRFERVISMIFKELYKGRWSKGENPWTKKEMKNTAYLAYDKNTPCGVGFIEY